MKKLLCCCFLLFSFVVGSAHAENSLFFLNQATLASSSSDECGAPCYVGQAGFCGCVADHQVCGCKKEPFVPSAWCTVSNVITGINLTGIRKVCSQHTSSQSELDNCVEDLECFINGKTINKARPCAKKCNY